MNKKMKIVVIGGSGLIGTKVVNNIRQRGHEVVAASPSTGVNTITGEGLADALTGAQCRRRCRKRACMGGQGRPRILRNVGEKPPRCGSKCGDRASRGAVSRRHRTPARERIFPRKAGAGKPDQGISDSLHHRSCHPVLRIRRRYCQGGNRRTNRSGSCRHDATDGLGRRCRCRGERRLR